jgi:hypothetical protein
LKAKSFLRRFRNDEKGIGWVIGTAVLSILFLPFIFFPLNYAWDQLCGIIEADYTFVGNAALALICVKLIISYLMSLGLFATVIWSIVQAKARKYSP